MTEDFKKILVGVDDSADALAAFQYALHRAKADGAELIIASILEDDEMNVYQAMNKDYVHGERAELEQHINEYRHLAEQAGLTNVRAIIGEGNPGETIVKTIIPKVKPDLLIIGAEAKKGLAKHFGSQATYMVKHATISVLVVRE
ncbi:universal stress protein [Lacticaseibacillus daqingensis]|uniref:universal stress protein n=1 Tax=Lacticaseibacillus daqingensis TaxID=2486014 RepID=UPI000F79DB0F|nr:universal stress protein [Lacticaseibacillus daqingensis]